MSTFATRIWYGTFHEQSERRKLRFLPLFAWSLFVVLFVAARLVLPFQPTDAGMIHARILDALTHGQVWGRQALVGSLEFPLLSTVALLFARQIGHVAGLPGSYILVLVAQTWTVLYLLRMPQQKMMRIYVFLLLAVLMLSPEFQTAVFALDPNWISVVPAIAAFYHLVKWGRLHALRDAVLLAVNCGFLAFSGPAGAALGLILLVVTAVTVRRLRQHYPDTDINGVSFIVWAPFAYCVLLFGLVNWLIMRDVAFPLHRLFRAIADCNIICFLEHTARQAHNTPWIIAGGLVVTAVSLNRRHRMPGIALICSLAGVVACHVLASAINLLLPADALLQMTTGSVALLFPCLVLQPSEGRHKRWLAALILMALAMAAAIAAPNRPRQRSNRIFKSPPPRGYITAAVDQSWAGARIMAYGIRAPAFYCDVQEKRFVARLDFREKDLLWRARDEQVYLLVPPNNGTYYAETSTLADIHTNGRRWLLLEENWPDGWQLWRCILLPKNEHEQY